ncbi:MAG: hypothetical protein HC908_15535 [Calothrix sp. SM1_7_51]|nr:hypothetical protein [Calothrix sp. SM1_7_51]
MADSHLPTLAMSSVAETEADSSKLTNPWVKSAPDRTHHTKTNIVVVVVAPIVVVARRGTAVIRIVVPGTAPQSGSPIPSLLPQPSEGSKYLLL